VLFNLILQNSKPILITRLQTHILPMIPPKSIPQIADEYAIPHKTFYNHIQRDEFLKTNIRKGFQLPLQQKWIYKRFGYPNGVDKSDYDNVD
jgi:hypothetical protein